MSYETALQRVGELRQLAGAPGPGATTDATATSPGAFDAQLASQQAALAVAGGDGAAAGDADSAFSQYGLPVYSVADQYRSMGLPVPTAGGVGNLGMNLGGGATGQRMVALAQQELGVSETSTNDSSRIKEYRSATAGAENTPGPWCSYFVSWLAKNAGAPIGAGGNGTGYVPTLEAWGKQENRWAEFGSVQPQAGDIVIFNWDSSGISDHTGIVESVDADGTIHTIEGNSSNRVQRRDYAASTNDIKGFVRPG